MRIFVQTYGCSFNVSDSEHMMGLLKEAGHSIVQEQEKADLLILNTCTVKGPSETKFFKHLGALQKSGKNLVIAGCIAQTDQKKLSKVSIIGTDCIEDIVEVVEETAKGHIVQMIKRKNSLRLNLPQVRVNPHIEIVPINKGCLGSCTYCKTVHARGRLFSYAPEAIVERIEHAVSVGVTQIWLTSQDCGAYGKDIGTTLPKLLKNICEIPGDFSLRVGMANPDHIIGMVDDLIDAYKDPRIYRFLHIPVQAGSDTVLKRMKREYTVEQYASIVQQFRNAYPDITIATDIIVAFPGETDQDFEQTIELIKITRPDVLNLSRYWKREGTPAARMKQIDGGISTKRAKSAMELFRKYAKESNAVWKGWQGKATITEQSKRGGFVARNYAYKPIIIQHTGKRDIVGKTVKVCIEDVTSIDFRAKIITS